MSSDLKRKLKLLATICLLTSLAGVIFELVHEERLDVMSVVFGLPLGLIFGVLELFLFPLANKRFRRWSFTRIFLFKTILYTASIYLVIVIITTIVGFQQGNSLQDLIDLHQSPEPWILVLYTLVVFALLLFFLQINQLLGEGVLWKFIRGKYHKPREEERIFMFLDMKSSTSIAEKLGHVRFYTLLNDLFYEITLPVRQTGAEIYQYVGDEVVLTWEITHGLQHANCLKAFFLFREKLAEKSAYYLQNFGVKPEFKAGLHLGKVVSAQIGDLKREIIYNGDVLNTTARIQEECNTYQRDFLASGALIRRLPETNSYQWEMIDTVTLRGKENELELFSVYS